jgi:sarcosine oxidase / L-pipecolate oxidase
MMTDPAGPAHPPSHSHRPRAIIIGSGVYGASLAYTLASLPSSSSSSSTSPWSITILDRSRTGYAAPDAASYDLNKIIRSDYSDANFRALGKEAIRLWRDPESIWSAFYHETGVLFRSGYVSAGEESCASVKDREYVQAGIKGALEAEEGEDDNNPHLPSKAYHLTSPSEAFTVFPSACRELLGPGIITIGDEIGGQVKQDAYVNPRGGWADAADATHKTLEEAQRLLGAESLQIVGDSLVTELLFAESDAHAKDDKRRVIGVRTASGKSYTLTPEEQADGQSCVVLCTGSWTRDLLDKVLPQSEEQKRRQGKLPMTPSAQCVVTVKLPSEMARRYRGTPVSLNFNK